MSLTTSELKSLKRAALEPARVFGRRDYDPKPSGCIYHYPSADKGDDWYSPHFPQWMVRDGYPGNCGVLERAIQRYGIEEAPVTQSWYSYIRAMTDIERDDTFYPYFREDIISNYELRNGIVCQGYGFGSIVVPATPVMYAVRRWGERLTWTSHRTHAVGHLPDGGTGYSPVILIRAYDEFSGIKVWEPPTEEAA